MNSIHNATVRYLIFLCWNLAKRERKRGAEWLKPINYHKVVLSNIVQERASYQNTKRQMSIGKIDWIL